GRRAWGHPRSGEENSRPRANHPEQKAPMSGAEALLRVQHVGKRFGGLNALTDVTLDVHPGEIFGLIGPNGAGKTTLFNVVTGVYAPDSGVIRFGSVPVSGLKPHVIAHHG